jgi:hypothetical protein
MSLRERLDRFWYMPAPAERLAAVRVLIGAYAFVYLLIRSVSLTSVVRFSASEYEPIGVALLVERPLPSLAVYATWVVAALSGLAFTTGYRYRLSAPLFAASFLWVTTYRSSWGMIFHTENLTALHLLLLAFAPAADVLSVDARTSHTRADGAEGGATDAISGRYGWALRAISAVTVASYVLAGVAKLRLGGSAWVDGGLLRAQVAYDNLRKIELGSVYSPLGALIVRYAWPFRALALASLALELGAPLALLNTRLARFWVLGVFGFHVGVLALMAIAFPYQLSFIAYASFFPVERLTQRLRSRWQRTQSATH